MPRKIVDFVMKPYTKSALAGLYTISDKTFVKWLKMASIETGKRRILTPKEVQAFVECHGLPETYYSEEGI